MESGRTAFPKKPKGSALQKTKKKISTEEEKTVSSKRSCARTAQEIAGHPMPRDKNGPKWRPEGIHIRQEPTHGGGVSREGERGTIDLGIRRGEKILRIGTHF